MDDDRREPLRVLVFAASLRAGSINVRLAQLAANVIEGLGASVDLASMREFDAASYDGDKEDDGLPAGAQEFRARLEAANAFVIVSPEYNASMPGVLKNAIDWVSRARPQPFNQRHGLLMSASPSMVGGNRGLWALRVPLEHMGARVYPDMPAQPWVTVRSTPRPKNSSRSPSPSRNNAAAASRRTRAARPDAAPPPTRSPKHSGSPS
jgi:NAD(P)H-dependent FMN reductase